MAPAVLAGAAVIGASADGCGLQPSPLAHECTRRIRVRQERDGGTVPCRAQEQGADLKRGWLKRWEDDEG